MYYNDKSLLLFKLGNINESSEFHIGTLTIVKEYLDRVMDILNHMFGDKYNILWVKIDPPADQIPTATVNYGFVHDYTFLSDDITYPLG